MKEKRSNGKRLVSYTHDAAGQITEIKDPAGIATKYEYDIMGRQSHIYNDSGLEVRYSYDALDRISHIRYGNGVETAYAYDADGNIRSMETKAGETVLLSFAYEYDGNGNRTAKTGMQMTAGSSALDILMHSGMNWKQLDSSPTASAIPDSSMMMQLDSII